MSPRIKRVRHLKAYELELRFTNGLTGSIDLQRRVIGCGGVFRQLEDIAFFKQVRLWMMKRELSCGRTELIFAPAFYSAWRRENRFGRLNPLSVGANKRRGWQLRSFAQGMAWIVLTTASICAEGRDSN